MRRYVPWIACLCALVAVFVFSGGGAADLASRAEVKRAAPGDAVAAEAAGPVAAEAQAEADRVAATPSTAGSEFPPSPDELHGIVIDALTKAPVTGSTIELLFADFDSFEELDVVGEPPAQPRCLATTTSDGAGRFHFAVERAAAHRLRARANGYAESTARDRVGGQVVTIDLSRAASLTCVLRTETDFAEDVDLEVRAEEGYVALARARTDAAGTVRFAGLRPGKVYVNVLGAAFQGQFVSTVLVPAEEKRLEIPVVRGAVTRGIVRDASTGHPIAGAVVSRDPGWLSCVRTDANGRFELASIHSAAGLRYWVQARGWAPAQGEVAFGASAEVEIRLSRGAVVTGRVLGANGEPMAGSHGFLAAAERAAAPGIAFDRRLLQIDHDGRFEVTCLLPGEPYWLLVRAPAHGAVVRALPRVLTEGERLELPDLVMLTQSIVAGRVVDPRGQPCSNFVVEVAGVPPEADTWLEGGPRPRVSSYVSKRITRTDTNGRYCIGGLASGEYEVAVQLPGQGNRIETTLRLAAEEVREGIDFVADVGLPLAGRLVPALGADDEPFATLMIVARKVGGAGPNMQWTAVDADGSFRFVGLAAGSYTIELGGQLQDQLLLTQPPFEAGREDLRLLLEPVVYVTGKVLDFQGAPALARVMAHETAAGPILNLVTTEANGEFRLGVPRGFRGCIRAMGRHGKREIAVIENVAEGHADLVLQFAPPDSRR